MDVRMILRLIVGSAVLVLGIFLAIKRPAVEAYILEFAKLAPRLGPNPPRPPARFMSCLYPAGCFMVAYLLFFVVD